MKKISILASSVAVAAILCASPSALAQRLARETGGGALDKIVNAETSSARQSTVILPPRSAKTAGFARPVTSIGGISGNVILHKTFGVGNLPDLRGSVVFNKTFTTGNAPKGLYKVNATGTEQLFTGPDALYGGVAVNDIYYTTTYRTVWGAKFVTIKGYDIDSGSEVASYSGYTQCIVTGGATVDPTTGDVYAITLNSDESGLQLTRLQYTTEKVTATPVAPISGYWNSLACDPQGQLYAIGFDGEDVDDSFVVTSSTLYKLDKTTAEATPIGVTGQCPAYASASTIDPNSGRMFWTVSPADGKGLLCEVNLATGATTVLGRFANDDEVCGLYVHAPAVENNAPGAISDLSLDFPEGALSGSVNFKAPSVLADGTAASGEITYTITANGTQVAQGSTSYGADVSASVSLPSAQTYKFVIFVSNSNGDGPRSTLSSFIGNGLPASTKVTLTSENGKIILSWLPVETAVDGGYINPANITYSVTRYPDEVEVATGLTSTSFEEALPEPENLTSYYYGVTVHNGERTSAEALSNSVTTGSIVPPYSNSFDDSSSLNAFTIIDSNGDGTEWEYNSRNGYVYVGYNSDLAMDDWLITPPIKLEANQAYHVSFSAKGSSNMYTERVEVKLGNAPTAEAMTQVIFEPIEIEWRTMKEFVMSFIAPSSGLFYLGFHGISDPDNDDLCIDDIKISTGVATTAPDKVTDIVTIPDPDGALSTTISFKAPSLTVGGSELSEISRIEVQRDGTTIRTFESPNPGEGLTFSDTPETGGEVTYTFVPYNSYGFGNTATAVTHVGIFEPAAIKEVTIVENPAKAGEVTVGWTPVTTNKYGDAINPAKVAYKIGQYDPSLNDWIAVSPELTGTSFTYQAMEDGKQDFIQVAVFAVTDGGETGTASPMIPCGTPYENFAESFSNGDFAYPWGVDGFGGGAEWSNFTDADFGLRAQDNDNGFVGVQAGVPNDFSSIFTGKISLEGLQKPGLSFYTYNLTGANVKDNNEIQIFVKRPSENDWTDLGNAYRISELSTEAGWVKINAPLDAYAGEVIQLRIQAISYSYAYTLIDNIKVGNLAAVDLVAYDIKAPRTVKAGSEYDITVQIRNEGTEAAQAFTVDLCIDNEPAQSKSYESLEAGASMALTFNCAMDQLAQRPVSIFAKVNCTNDELPENNTGSTITVTPEQSTLPAVSDLSAKPHENGILLSWSTPDTQDAFAGLVNEDFESATSFAHEYEGWTFIDRDESPVGGFNSISIPGIESRKSLCSFFVFDCEGAQYNVTFSANSGTKYLASLYRADGGVADDWAISPMLAGIAQTITFHARSYSDQYPEKIEMLYSTGSLNPDDFIIVAADNAVPSLMAADQSTAIWMEYSFEVPEGAKYFAIRSCAQDGFMLELDDFEFLPDGADVDVKITGYDIYRDSQCITEEPVTDCSYFDTTAGIGSHDYVVVTVYGDEKSAPSNMANIDFTDVADLLTGYTVKAVKGMVIITGAEGCEVTVSNAAGVSRHFKDAPAVLSVPATNGIYIVVVDGKAHKLFVH